MTIRVSPPKVFPVATGASKPPAEAGGSADAYRQTSFVLDDPVALVLEGLNAEGAIAQATAGSKYRTQRMASAMVLWSRSWLARLQALHSLQWGNYSACTPLVRSTADYQASMLYLLRTEAVEWQEWLDAGGIAIAPEQHATEFQLHAFRAAEILAAHDILGPVYRATMDLSLSHFGSSLLFAGGDSAPDHISVTFGDRDFHMGLAELHLGWLLELGIAQGQALREFDGVLAFGDGAGLPALETRAAAWLKTTSRCRLEQTEVNGELRSLIHNWRREPRSAPKRILL
jgi:hypothetical protein